MKSWLILSVLTVLVGMLFFDQIETLISNETLKLQFQLEESLEVIKP